MPTRACCRPASCQRGSNVGWPQERIRSTSGRASSERPRPTSRDQKRTLRGGALWRGGRSRRLGRGTGFRERGWSSIKGVTRTLAPPGTARSPSWPCRSCSRETIGRRRSRRCSRPSALRRLRPAAPRWRSCWRVCPRAPPSVMSRRSLTGAFEARLQFTAPARSALDWVDPGSGRRSEAADLARRLLQDLPVRVVAAQTRLAVGRARPYGLNRPSRTALTAIRHGASCSGARWRRGSPPSRRCALCWNGPAIARTCCRGSPRPSGSTAIIMSRSASRATRRSRPTPRTRHATCSVEGRSEHGLGDRVGYDAWRDA